MNSLILIPVFVCPAPNLFQQREILPCRAPASCRHHLWYQKPSSPMRLIHSAAQGLPQKIPGSATSTDPAGCLLWDGSPAPWSLNMDFSHCPVSGKILEHFLAVFCEQSLTITFFFVSEQWKGLKNYLRSRKSHPCQCPHSSAGQMLRTSHLKCPCSGANTTRAQPC